MPAASPVPAAAHGGAPSAASMPDDHAVRESVAPVPRLAAAPATAGNASPEEPLPAASSEETAYKSALALALAGRTAAARQAFAQVRQQHPQGGHAADTQFWLAECHYRQGHYRDAAQEFTVMTEQYGGHYKASDAQFKVGVCYARLGDSERAAQAFRQVLANFPQSEAARLVRQRKLVHPQ